MVSCFNIEKEKGASIIMKRIPGGVYPVMITPYTEDLQIDYVAVEQLLQWYKKGGCQGIFALCQSSEIFSLTFDERLSLIDFIMKHRPEGVAIVASGHVSDDLDTAVYEAEKIIETGVDAYVFITNRFAKQDEDDDVLLKNMFAMADRLPEIPLGVYEAPGPYHRKLTPYVLREMIKDERFQFIKDTCCSISMLRERLDIVRNSNLGIFNANAATLLESLKMGAAGFSGVMANFYPEIIVEECRCFKENPEKAEQLQDFVGFCSAAEGQVYSSNCKYFLQLEGLDITTKSRTCDDSRLDELKRLSAQQLHGMKQFYDKLFSLE